MPRSARFDRARCVAGIPIVTCRLDIVTWKPQGILRYCNRQYPWALDNIYIFLNRRWLARQGLSDRLNLQGKRVANYEKPSRKRKILGLRPLLSLHMETSKQKNGKETP